MEIENFIFVLRKDTGVWTEQIAKTEIGGASTKEKANQVTHET